MHRIYIFCFAMLTVVQVGCVSTQSLTNTGDDSLALEHEELFTSETTDINQAYAIWAKGKSPSEVYVQGGNLLVRLYDISTKSACRYFVSRMKDAEKTQQDMLLGMVAGLKYKQGELTKEELTKLVNKSEEERLIDSCMNLGNPPKSTNKTQITYDHILDESIDGEKATLKVKRLDGKIMSHTMLNENGVWK